MCSSAHQCIENIPIETGLESLCFLRKARMTTKPQNTCISIIQNNKMQSNPDKFQAIMLGKSGFENCKSLFLNGTEIKCEDSVKLLGVTINYLLNSDLHVSNICKKAARQINVLLRLSKFLTIEKKNLIYKSFIRSSFNFCPLVWHFCSKTSSAKMEKLQNRALRLVFNDFDSPYETLLERVNMPTLHISRIRLIAVETFKILHKMSPVYLQDLLSYKILSTLSDMTTW